MSQKSYNEMVTKLAQIKNISEKEAAQIIIATVKNYLANH
jgi:hypothetical protein